MKELELIGQNLSSVSGGDGKDVSYNTRVSCSW